MKNYVGIDLSKKDFHATGLGGSHQVICLSNDLAGMNRLLAHLGENDQVIFEATGPYSLLLMEQLDQAGISFSVINPRESKYFSAMLNKTWKDDVSDAHLLRLYGEKMNPKPSNAPSEAVMELKQKRAFLRQLQKQKTANQNFLSSMQPNPWKDAETENHCEQLIQTLEKKIQQVKDSIAKIVEENYGGLLKLVASVKGIGQKTAWALIEATQGFEAFETAEEFAKYIGICPTHGSSGSSVRQRSRINRSGDPETRALLYLCTWSAIRYNKDCKNMYERLKGRGKPSKVALVAVMNKLVHQVLGVVQSGQPFDNDYQEKRAAQRQQQLQEQKQNKWEKSPKNLAFQQSSSLL